MAGMSYKVTLTLYLALVSLERTSFGEESVPTFDELCQKASDNPKAKVKFDDPNKLCKKPFWCKYYNETAGDDSLKWSGKPAPAGTPCGNGGTCKDGSCSGQVSLFSLDELCQKALENPEARVQYDDPNKLCSKQFWCLTHNATTGDDTSKWTGITAPEGTPCGNNGTCQNKSCSGQTSPFTLDELCQKVLANPEAKVKFDAPNKLCNKPFWCRYNSNSTEEESVKWSRIKAPEGTPCGNGGTCGNGSCIGQTSLYTFDELCQKALDNPEAKIHFDDPNNLCIKPFRCKYLDATKGEEISKWTGITAPEGTLCGNGGTCTNGSCIGQTSLYTFDELCQKGLGNPEARVVFDNPNTMCSKPIWCRSSNGSDNDLTTIYSGIKLAPEGTPCGNEGVCEKGICSGQKTLFTVDELCQKVLENPEAKAEFNVPNGYCSQRLKCKYDTPDGPTTKGTRITPSEGTPCGEGGVCANGTCNGETKTEPLTLDQLCQKALDKPDAKVIFDDPNVHCSKELRCRFDIDSSLGFMKTKTQIIAPEGTPCGDGGKCEENKCADSKPYTIDKICQIVTGDAEAKPKSEDFNEMCSALKCKYNFDVGRYLIASVESVPEGTLCGTKDGVCKGGKCAEEA